MSRILTDYERKVWRESAIELIEHPGKMFSSQSYARNRLRYEATLQAKDTQIAALVTALEEIRDMTVCDALGDRFERAAMAARIAIKEATDGP